MSGTSIDGIDLCYCSFTIDKVWSYRIIKCKTVVYGAHWVNKLSHAISLSKSEIPILNKEYTSYLALVINNFIEKNKLTEIDFISSHGHTIFHKPEINYTFQLGNLRLLQHCYKYKIPLPYLFQHGGQVVLQRKTHF